MKHTLLAIALASAGIAHAECYSRSAMSNHMRAQIERITDVHETVVPTPTGQKRCTVIFRSLINGAWHSGEGMSQARPETPAAQLCNQAMTSGQTFLLQSIGGSRMAMEQEMVCSDEPKPYVRLVNVGEVIRESEVQPHARNRRPFIYKGSTCRWFSQFDPHQVVLEPQEGIMCKMNNDQWKVVDKF
jgi:hypothetical protein